MSFLEGYTSISVREPLANILAQQPPHPPVVRNPTLASRDVSDSHYATVSDDSGELMNWICSLYQKNIQFHK